MRNWSPRHALAVSACCLVALGVLSGCVKTGPKDRAIVLGRVEFKGKGLPGGSIRVVSAADPRSQVIGRLRADGTFTLTGAPTGPVKIAVETESVREDAPGPHRPAFVAIPAKYTDPDKSGLTGDIPAEGGDVLHLQLD